MKTLDGNDPYFKFKNRGNDIYTIDTNILALDIPISDLYNPTIDISDLKFKDNDFKIYFMTGDVKYNYIYQDGSDWRIRNVLFEGNFSVYINYVNKIYRFDYGKILEPESPIRLIISDWESFGPE